MLIAMAAMLLLQQPEQLTTQYKKPGVRDAARELPLKYSTPLAQLASLTVYMDKQPYEAGEAVTIRLVVRNASDQAFLCHCTLMYAAIDVQYRLGDEPYRLLKFMETPAYVEMSGLYRLEHDEAVSETTWIAYDYGKAAPPFDRAGRYEVRVVYYDDPNRTVGSRIASEPVEVEVRTPTEQEAFEAYRGDLAKLAHLRGGGPATDTIITKAADFMERFGTSVYAADVQFALASMLEYRVYKVSNGMLRDDATEEHRRLYERYRVKPKPLY